MKRNNFVLFQLFFYQLAAIAIVLATWVPRARAELVFEPFDPANPTVAPPPATTEVRVAPVAIDFEPPPHAPAISLREDYTNAPAFETPAGATQRIELPPELPVESDRESPSFVETENVAARSLPVPEPPQPSPSVASELPPPPVPLETATTANVEEDFARGGIDRNDIPSNDGDVAERVARVPDEWWDLGSDSPIAIALGSAEGTRRPNGGKNPAYYWHEDPGNGADNFGTFSYQHLSEAEKVPVRSVATAAQKRETAEHLGLPDKSDRLQLQRLKRFHDELRQQAIDKELPLDFMELANGLDLANQSPAAAMTAWGYLDRLKQMKRLLDDPTEQVLEARTWSYWEPDYEDWDAPGLGNTYDSIRRDQARRFYAVRDALAHQLP